MKKKKIILLSVLCLLAVAFSIIGFSACDGKCDHQFGEWSVKTEATCTEAGVQERKCSKCEEIETAKINALGHDFSAATCTAPKTCKNCSATEGVAGAHSFVLETVKSETLKSAASCTSAAVYYKSCACGAISDTITFTNGSALPHSYTLEVKSEDTAVGEITCEHAGTYYKTCSSCGKISVSYEDTFTTPHVFDREIVSAEAEKEGASCSIAATYYKSCSCGVISDNDADVFTSGVEGVHYFVLEIVSDAAKKSDATCTSAAVYYKSCSCGTVSQSAAETFTYGDVAEHSFVLEIVKPDAWKSDATCTSAAKYYKSCECGEVSDNDADVFTSGDPLPHDHKIDEENSTPATCTSPAIIRYVCTCGDWYEDEDGAALDHDITGATAVERRVDGCEYVLVYTCQRPDCGEEVLGKTVYHHNHIASIKTPATCKDDGEKIFVCACGDELDPEPIPADTTGHNWVKGEVGADGKRTDKCSVCEEEKVVTVYTGTETGKTNADDLRGTEIELNDANITLGDGVIDQIGNQDVTVSAGKLEGDDRKNLGITEEQLENQVGDSPIYDFSIKDENGNPISQFGENKVTVTLPYELGDNEDVDSIHVWFIGSVCAKEDCPNYGGECAEEGHYLVSIEATYNNGFVTFETNHFSYYTVTKLTPAERCELYGHNYGKPLHVDGGCTMDSYDLYVCVRCHDKKTENYVVAPGHSYTADTHEATCTEDGYVLYSCDNCEHSYRTKLVKTGHAWSVIDSSEASCTENGFVKYGCDNGCGGEYTDLYEKAAHEYTDTVIEATCTADGYTLYECDNCGHTYTDDYVAALGHTYEVVEWAWAADYSSASLTLVCVNDGEHTLNVPANIVITVLNGTCSSFTRTTYTAGVSYNGVVYNDEKVVEVGTPDHVFSKEWSSNETAHWHECVCGEKTDVTEHTFGEPIVTVEPTCVEVGQSVAYCTVCDEDHIAEIPATGNHEYENGVCKECGAEKGADAYYVNLINSWKNVNGFAIKIKDLSFEVQRKNSSLTDAFSIVSSIKQVNIAELALYVEDGELCGAATGDFEILDGPIFDGNALYRFDAVINDGYVYIKVEYGKTAYDNEMNMKMSVDALMEWMLEETDSSAVEAISFISDTLISTIDSLIAANTEQTNKILEGIFNMIFTFEKQDDGTYVATLDYDKIYALNENLATKTVAEFIDIYFGEGAFDGLTASMLEIMNLKVSDVPAYVNGLGVDFDALIAKINEFAKSNGAPDGYDVGAIFKDEAYADVTLGMLMFGVADDSYVAGFNESVELLEEVSLYALIMPDSVDGIKGTVDSVVGMIAENVYVSFTTDVSGMLLSVNLGVDDFIYEDETGKLTLNFDFEIIINGRIDVTWADIIEEIENGIVEPDDEMLDDEMSYEYSETYDEVEYNGEMYWYEGIEITAYKPLYDYMTGIMFTPNCAGWMEYEVAYAAESYRFVIARIEVDGEPVMLLIDRYTDEVVEIIASETGATVILADGTEKEITIDFSEYENEVDAYAALYFAVFEDAQSEISLIGDGAWFYYNAETKEYAYESQHDIETEYVVNGNICEEDGVTVYKTCKNCDYTSEYTEYWCDREYGVKIDLSEYSTCGGTVTVDRCQICGDIKHIYEDSMNINCNMDGGVEEVIVDEDGNVIGASYISKCTECGLEFVMSEWIEEHSECEYTEWYGMYIISGDTYILEYTEGYFNSNHQWEYEFEGESCQEMYTVYEYCTVCGETNEYKRSGHFTKEIKIDLAEKGFCDGGYIAQSTCLMCKEVLYTSVNDYNCWWQHKGVNDEGYTVYECSRCGGTKLVYTYDSEKDENCSYTHVENRVYLKNGEEICRYEATYRFTSHDYEYDFILNGTSCEDGYTVIESCKDCGYTHSYERSGHNSYVVDRVNLQEHGTCGDEFIYMACPCGEYTSFYYGCAYISTGTNEYEEDGKLYYAFARYCEKCNLRFDVRYYTVKDNETCTMTYYYSIVITIEGQLIAEREYEVVKSHHECDTTVTLVNGVGSSCEDGVIIANKCKYCDYEAVNTYNYHYTYEKERINLADYGSTCGGYVTLNGCACNYQNTISREHEQCDMNGEWCELWIENALTDYYNESYIYTCAVTDPACAFKIRYATYYLKAENECYAYQYQTWQFGYNEETGEYQYAVTFKTGNRGTYHSYERVEDTYEGNVHITKDECSVCGSYQSDIWYYDDNNNIIRHEENDYNALGKNRDTKYYQAIWEYSFDENGMRYSSRQYFKNTYYDDSIDSDEWIYEAYSGYTYVVYHEYIQSDYWYKNEYSYSFEDECIRTIRYTNSNGIDETRTENCCRFGGYVTIKAPTCTQSGEACNECVICGKQGELHTVEPTDHNWVNVINNWHYCYNCGLENQNGASGVIIMEDLTEKYGNGENYVVGYYNQKNVEFTYYVSLILADGEEIIVDGIEFTEIDGLRAIAFSKAAVDTWASENGYTEYDVRFAFVPYGGDSSFDYAITFAEPTVDTENIVGNVSFTDYISEGETKTYTIVPAKGGEWVFTAFADRDSYVILYDAEGNEIASDDDGGYNGNFRLVYELIEGETYYVGVRWFNGEYAGEMPLLFGSQN